MDAGGRATQDAVAERRKGRKEYNYCQTTALLDMDDLFLVHSGISDRCFYWNTVLIFSAFFASLR
jgi:hypothetical protein